MLQNILSPIIYGKLSNYLTLSLTISATATLTGEVTQCDSRWTSLNRQQRKNAATEWTHNQWQHDCAILANWQWTFQQASEWVVFTGTSANQTVLLSISMSMLSWHPKWTTVTLYSLDCQSLSWTSSNECSIWQHVVSGTRNNDCSLTTLIHAKLH